MLSVLQKQGSASTSVIKQSNNAVAASSATVNGDFIEMNCALQLEVVTAAVLVGSMGLQRVLVPLGR